MNELEKRIQYVKEHYPELPKSKSNIGEFVMIAIAEDYSECCCSCSKEGIGINKNGDLMRSAWANDEARGSCIITDIDRKNIFWEKNLNALSFYDKYKTDIYESFDFTLEDYI